MNKTKKVCDLCGLAVEMPGFTLKTKEGEKGLFAVNVKKTD